MLFLPFTLLMRGLVKYSDGTIESIPELFFGVNKIGLTIRKQNLYFGYGKRRILLYRFNKKVLITFIKTGSKGKTSDFKQLNTIVKFYRSVSSGLRLKVITLTGYYGFNNPMQTGQISGTISAIKHVLPAKTELNLIPIFQPQGLPKVYLEGCVIIGFRPIVIGINFIKNYYK